jgi:glutamate--cysteine ligase
MTKALAAFWKGILYDGQARAAAWDEVKGFDLSQRKALMDAAGREALWGKAPDGRSLAGLAAALVEIAARGLCRQHCCGQRGEDERCWLDPLRERASAARSPADEALEAFRARGDRAMAAVLRVA